MFDLNEKIAVCDSHGFERNIKPMVWLCEIQTSALLWYFYTRWKTLFSELNLWKGLPSFSLIHG